MLSLKFLYDVPTSPTTLCAEEVSQLAQQVNLTLRENRGVRDLSDEEVLFGNKFLISLVVFSRVDKSLELDILPSDIEYMLQEINYLDMGYKRN
jgi:hypothetical protein